jgi:hypothetical protein
MKLGLTWGQKLGLPECPYMRRWVLNMGRFSIRIHHWYSSDDHRAWHDHPWWFWTLVLRGGYTDVSPIGRENLWAGRWASRPALHRHTVEVWPGGCWTLVITGRPVRKWGFWPNGKFKKANKYFLEHGHHPCA